MNEENGKVGDIELSGFENVFKFFSSSKEESVYVVIHFGQGTWSSMRDRIGKFYFLLDK